MKRCCSRGKNEMRRWEKAVLLSWLVYTAVFVGLIIYFTTKLDATGRDGPEWDKYLPALGFIGGIWGWLCIALAIRDLYLRPFPNPNSKVTWTLLIIMTGGIGCVVYLVKYALKPRPPANQSLHKQTFDRIKRKG